MVEDRRRFAAALCSTQRFADHDPDRKDGDARVYVRVWVGEKEVHAMVDTGAPWCIIPPPVGPEAPSDVPVETLWIRGEPVSGRRTRADLVLVADDGEPLRIDATFFVPEPDWLEGGWPHPYFLGVQGMLRAIYFGLDLSRTLVHFAPG